MIKTNNKWLWPNLIAHRGGGKLAPENTLSAFRACQNYRIKMAEYDVKLSKDNIAILLHDDCINRTSNGTGQASNMNINQLLNYDFGSWHSNHFAGEPLATLYSIARFTITNQIHSNIEIKPSPGLEALTGEVIAKLAKNLWANTSLTPLLSSFSELSLAGAMQAAPELPRALLIEGQLPSDWLERVQSLACIGLNLDNNFISKEIVAEITGQGFTLAVWNVNNLKRAQEILSWGCNAIFTDLIDEINPSTI